MSFIFNGVTIENVYFNGVKMGDVYMNGTKVKESGITCSPASLTEYNAGNVYTTPNVTISGAGTLYVGASLSYTPDYFELEWYKNNVYQGYIVVFDGSGGYYLGPGSITVANGDLIKFRVSQASMSAWEMRRDNSSGVVVYQAFTSVTP